MLKVHNRHSWHNWEEILAVQQKFVYNLAYQLCGNSIEASDLAQETFVKAFPNLAGLKQNASLRTWLSRITVNAYLMKHKGKENHALMTPEITPTPECPTNPAKVIMRRELQWCINNTLQQHLPRDYRIVLVLRDLNQLSYCAIAGILAESEDTVKSRLYKARLSYRDHLLKSGCAGLVTDYRCYCERVREQRRK
ncbi:MAG: hypothetical protein JL56_10245 [Desulfotomaculum sp. BICA1-6]|nr:MAG: hypothetical protein JL56_10245 [Desulfotomaculum sp. BICA1-6]